MLYRLLRNNKESGPYTALQLKEMGLKPYDLLWAEGRGAAWQYASELAELKAFAPSVEEQPFDRFYKKKENEPVTVQQPAVAEKKVKPRFRISGDKIIMVEAGNMEVANNGVIKETSKTILSKEPVVAEKIVAAPDWQNAYTEWQPQTKPAKKGEPAEIETKYSESLDNLKKRYAEKVLNEKTEKPISSVSSASLKQNIMAAVALLVLAVGGYIGYTLKQKDNVKTNGQPTVERADIAGDNSLSSPQTGKANDESNSGKTSEVKSPVDNSTLKTSSKKEAENKTTVAAPLKKEADNTNKASAPIKDQKDVFAKASNNAANNKPVAQIPANGANKTTNTTVPAPVETKPVAKQNIQKKIGDYVSVKKISGSANSVENVRLVVSNVSDFPIDLAVVDIQYFDSKGKYQKGETMYVKNIDGGNNVEVRVPDSEHSSSIKYKVSLVSSEQKTLYLVAD